MPDDIINQQSRNHQIDATSQKMVHSKRESLLSDGAWIAFGQISAALGALASVRILTELLTIKVFGSISLFMGIVLLAQGMVSTPLIQAMLRLHPDHAKQGEARRLYRAVGKMLGIRTLGMSFVIMLAGVAARQYFEFTIEMILIIAGLLCSETWRAYRINFFNAERRQREFALWLAADGWLKPLAAWLMVLLLNATAETVFLGYVLASVVVTLILYLREKNLPVNPSAMSVKNDETLHNAINLYSLPLIPLSMVGWFNGMVDRYMIGGTLGLEHAGLYVAVYGLVSRPFLMVGTIVEQTYRQAYYQAISHGDKHLACHLFRQWLSLVAMACLIGLSIIWILKEPIARIFLGANFRSAAFLMPWVAASYSLLTLSQVFERRFYANRYTSRVLLTQLAGALSLTFLLILLLKPFGIIGAAWSLLVACLIQLGVSALSYGPTGWSESKITDVTN